MFPPEYWSTSKKLMLLGAMAGGKLVEAEAVGNPLTFLTEKAKPLRSLLIPFTPVQSGTGDPSPQNVRSIVGWNGLTAWHYPKQAVAFTRTSEQTANGITWTPMVKNGRLVSVHVQGARTTSNNFYNLFGSNVESIPVGSYKVGGFTDNVAFRVYAIIDGNETLLMNTANGQTTFTVTAEMTRAWMRLQFVADLNVPVDEVICPIVVKADESIDSYPVVFPAQGKNLANMQYGNKVPSISSGQMVGSNGWSTPFIPVDTSKAYYLSRNNTAGNIYVLFYDSEYNYIRYASVDNARVDWMTGFSSCSYIKLRNDSGSTATMEIQLEQNTQATPYEPFDNTVYGGTLDMVTGVLTVRPFEDFAFKWSENTSGSVIGDVERRGFVLSKQVKTPEQLEADATARFCNVAPWKYNYLSDDIHFYGGSWSFYVFLPVGTDEDTEIHLLVERATTPQTFQLTPQQITALVGSNTIWSDTNGENTVVYLKKA